MSVELRTNAINAFITGCKADGTWDAIKACCILAGWNGLTGALVPLKGTAPTNFNFVSGDYNRQTGLVGNGTTKHLNSNFLASNLSTSSNHMIFRGSSFPVSVSGFRTAMGAFKNGAPPDRLTIELCTNINTRNFNGPFPAVASLASGQTTSGGVAGSRISASLSTLYQDGVAVATDTTTATGFFPAITIAIFGFNNNNNTVDDRTSARFNYYGIGDGLTGTQVAAYDARITTLITTLGAIP
jgi:hypothetical protein